MKFSVLLPTRNRLELLRYAVETVRRQDYDDWEIVISDNCSEEDVAGYVRSLDDARIRYFRTESFIPVTENWNNALEKSTGDYVIMLGDDDGLMPDYFSTIRRLVDEYDSPDAIYSKAFLYAYPGAFPGVLDGYLEPSGCADFLKDVDAPFWLDKSLRLELVKQTMDFRYRYDFNMQYMTVSRKFIESLRGHGEFYQSPFPDYYATNVTFLEAERVLVYPHPLVIIGISPKSYGFFHFNLRDAEGKEFLKGAREVETPGRLRRVVMSGTNMNDGWLFAMEAIKKNYGGEFGLHVNYRRYRLLQTVFVVIHISTKEAVSELIGQMRLWEKAIYGAGIYLYRLAKRLIRPERYVDLKVKLLDAFGQYPRWYPKRVLGLYKNLLDVFEKSDPRAALARVRPKDDICVVHLVRERNGLAPFRDFIESYRAHPAGVGHALLIIFKGFGERPDLSEYEALLQGISYQSFFVPDEGFDLLPYFRAAQSAEYDYLCFLNSFSVILDSDWLAKMYKHSRRDDVGLVGATGSWTSHYSGIRYQERKRSRYDVIMADLEDQLRPKIPKHRLPMFELSEGLKEKIRGMPLPLRLARWLYYYGIVAPYYLVVNSIPFFVNSVRSYFEQREAKLSQLRTFSGDKYDPFPTPHLRTNAFMIRRDLMFSLMRWEMLSKADAHRFESGKESMTNQVLRMDLKVVVVGRDGRAYEKQEWPLSETFFQGDQRNLLVADTQTMDYTLADAFKRTVLSRTAWGEEALPSNRRRESQASA